MRFKKYINEGENYLQEMGKAWQKQYYKGQLFDKKTGKYIGSVFVKGKSAIVLDVERGNVKKLIGKYDFTKFKKAGTEKVTAKTTLQKWHLEEGV